MAFRAGKSVWEAGGRQAEGVVEGEEWGGDGERMSNARKLYYCQLHH